MTRDVKGVAGGSVTKLNGPMKSCAVSDDEALLCTADDVAEIELSLVRDEERAEETSLVRSFVVSSAGGHDPMVIDSNSCKVLVTGMTMVVQPFVLAEVTVVTYLYSVAPAGTVIELLVKAGLDMLLGSPPWCSAEDVFSSSKCITTATIAMTMASESMRTRRIHGRNPNLGGLDTKPHDEHFLRISNSRATHRIIKLKGLFEAGFSSTESNWALDDLAPGNSGAVAKLGVPWGVGSSIMHGSRA